MTVIISGNTGTINPAGSAALPSITGGVANTGIYFPSPTVVAFSASGSTVLTLDNTGNVVFAGNLFANTLTSNLLLGSTNFGGNISVGGAAVFSGNTSINNVLAVSSNLSVGGNATISQSLNVSGDTAVTGNLYQNGVTVPNFITMLTFQLAL